MFKDKFWLALSIDRPVSIQARTDNYGTLMRPCSRTRDCENSDSTFSVFPHDFWNQGHALDAILARALLYIVRFTHLFFLHQKHVFNDMFHM